MYRVAFDTFGCRLNQAETAVLHDRFRARGWEVVDDPLHADLFVVNTCTLTGQAAARCRRRIRSVLRRSPGTCVAAIGCDAQTHAETLARIDGLDYIVGTTDKLRLPEIVDEPIKQPRPRVFLSRPARDTFTIDGVGASPAHARANIKVQEGCDFVCAFCLIPRSRGPARSRAYDDVLREARALVAAGHRELVVTGVNVGTWRDGRRRLYDLLAAMSDVDGIERVRISSIEPTTIDPRIVGAMERRSLRLCPYLHVPLQSGDDGVLTRMRRRYGVSQWRAFIDDALSRVPDLGIGTDVIVGFPGEDDAAFENTLRLISDYAWANVHVFPFSPRPRTSAFTMPDRVDPARIRDRGARLRRRARSRQADFVGAHVGRVVDVLVERVAPDGRAVGHTPNYVRVSTRPPGARPNDVVRVRVDAVVVDGDGVAARGDPVPDASAPASAVSTGA